MFSPSYMLVETYEQDRHRHEERRHAIHRDASFAAGIPGPSWTMRFKSAIANAMGRDHSLTDYVCRLPDGRMGRVAAIEQNGEWNLVCRAV